MKKTIVSILSMCFLTVLTAQKPISKQQLAEIWSSYEKGDVTRCVTERDMYVIRIHREGADPLSMNNPDNVVYSILSAPIPPHIKTANDFHKWLNLPPSSTVSHFSVMLVPKNTELWAGPIGASDWQKPAGSPYDAQKTNWLDGANAKNGGAIQLVIPASEKSKVTVVPNFSNQPFENIRQSYEMYPSSHNDYKPKPAEFDVHPSEDVQAVQKRYNDVPGGIIIEAKGKINSPIQSVKFDAIDCSFLINGAYRYRPGLRSDEIGQIANVVLFNSDKRLAAMSQTEFVNAHHQTSVARALVDADVLLGRILYGYGLDGNGVADSLMLPTYKNPLKNSLKDLGKWWTWKAKKTETEKISKGLEQRVFLEFDQITFQLNPSSHFVEPKGIGCKVNYQAFTYKKDGSKLFSSSAELQKYYPDLVEVAKHLSANFGVYSERFPAFLKIQKMAEVYALISLMRDNNIAIENIDILEAEGKQPYKFPFVYEGFNNVLPNSDLVKYHQKALKAVEWIPNWIFFNKEDKLKRINYKLHHALECMDFQKIKKYRAEAMSVAETLDDNKISEESKNIKKQLQWLIPSYISEKINFGNRYQAQGCYKSAVAYFELMRELEPNITNNFEKLCTLYELLGQDDDAKVAFQRYFSLLKQNAQKDADAMNSLAVLLFHGNSKYSIVVDKERAIELFNEAIKNNHALACYNLAYIYTEEKNYYNAKKGKELKELSHKLGYVEATNKLGIDAYYHSNYSVALDYLKQSAQEGNAESKYLLGLMYLNGEGVIANKDTAYIYFKQSSELGYKNADRKLTELSLEYLMSNR